MNEQLVKTSGADVISSTKNVRKTLRGGPREGILIWKHIWGGLLAKTVLSALHEKLEGEVKKLRLEKKKELEVLQPRINNKSELPTRE